MGQLDQARNLFDQHLSYAENHSDSVTLYHIYTFPVLYNLEAREWKSAVTILEEYLPIVREFGDPVFKLTAEIYYHLALGFQNDAAAFEKAIHLIHLCFDIGFKAFAVTMSSLIGELYVQMGHYEPALAWIKKIMAHVNQTGTHIHTAELFRIKGLALKALGKDTAQVEACFREALDRSKKQSARLFELRAATDLARLWQEQGKGMEAYALLQPVYHGFTGEYTSVDLQDASRLIAALES